MQSEHGGRLQVRHGLGWQRSGQGGNRQIWAWWRATLEGLGFRRARESTSNAARRAPPCKALGRAQSFPLRNPTLSSSSRCAPLFPSRIARLLGLGGSGYGQRAMRGASPGAEWGRAAWEGGCVWLRASGAGGDPSDGRAAWDGDGMAAGGDPRENTTGWRWYGGGRVAGRMAAVGLLWLRESWMELGFRGHGGGDDFARGR
ncbi:hypothetical protein GUJ93_ZPchr0008g13948 [Zizania palustris]|uniref:Uncharacterized protein n=1 Tax=Zizania palustris TaxID=103762 RepID=A0A8J5RKX4_ZIZPA|nr:hypothetical protein GUJ93_ZPchr0008g13948 [Zizania palustris]